MSYAESQRSSPRDVDDKPHHPPAVTAYTAIVAATAVALVALSWRFLPVTAQQVPAFVVLLVMGLLSMQLREVETGDQVSISFTSVVVISAVPLVGPAGAGLLGGVIPLLDRSSVPSVVRLFNAGMTSTISTLGGLGYVASQGILPISTSLDAGQLLLRVGLPLLVTNLVVSLSNIGVLSGMVYITSGEASRFLSGAVQETLPLYLAYTVISFLFVVLWVPADVGPLSGVLIMAPLLVARWIYAQYGDEVRAHNRILETLVVASHGGKRSGTGHGRRVDAIASLIAGHLGVSGRQSRSLQYAAALHDIGRLGLPTHSLARRVGEATAEDFAAIRRHPIVAQEIVRDIAFLEEAGIAIRHHHERVDGRGYPDGLAGEQVPLLSRIVAVADAFDALTCPLGGQPGRNGHDALNLLRRLSGTAFDRKVVEALAAIYADNPARIEPEGPVVRMGDELWWDHDDPAVAELLNSVRGPVGGQPG